MPWKTPLKESLCHLALRQMAADADYRKCRGITVTPFALTDGMFADYRQWKLTSTLRYAAVNSSFYRGAFAGIDVDSVRADDLSALPFTTADDLASAPFAFLCQSQTAARRAISFESSGTMGPRKRLFFSDNDLKQMADFMACGISTVADATDTVQILLPGTCAGGQSDLLRRGIEKMGASAVVTGVDLPFEEQIASIRAHGTTILFGETHLIYRLTKKMALVCDLHSLGVDTLFLTTSWVSPVMRAYLERAWGACVSVHYGMTEMGLGVAVACPVCGGMHYNELGVIAEAIDPVTRAPVLDGSEGEIVVTSIGREAMPIIRFRTGDMGRIWRASRQCPSASFDVLSEVAYRRAARVKLQCGMAITPTFFHDAVFSVPEVVDYELSVFRTDDGCDRLVFEVESVCDGFSVRSRLANSVQHALSVEHAMPVSLHVTIDFRSHEELRQGSPFKKLIKDCR